MQTDEKGPEKLVVLLVKFKTDDTISFMIGQLLRQWDESNCGKI